jgi:hypothetical protein
MLKNFYYKGSRTLVLRAMSFSFVADDEPIDIIFHVSSTREKQDYRRKYETIMSFIITDIYKDIVIVIVGNSHCSSHYYHVEAHCHLNSTN